MLWIIWVWRRGKKLFQTAGTLPQTSPCASKPWSSTTEKKQWKDQFGLGWEKAKWERICEKDDFEGSEFHRPWGVVQTVARKASSGPQLVEGVQRSKSWKLVMVDVGNSSYTLSAQVHLSKWKYTEIQRFSWNYFLRLLAMWLIGFVAHVLLSQRLFHQTVIIVSLAFLV